MLVYALGRDATGLALTWCLEKVREIESYEVSVGTLDFHHTVAVPLSRVTIFNYDYNRLEDMALIYFFEAPPYQVCVITIWFF